MPHTLTPHEPVPLTLPLVTHQHGDRSSAGCRVLFVTSMWPDAVRPHYGPFVASQARSLEARGICVDVLVARGYESCRAYVAARRALMTIMASDPPDLVHVHTGHAGAIGLARLGVPRVISYVGGDLLGEPRADGLTVKSRAEVTVFRQLARLSDAVITKSYEMAAVLPSSVQDRVFVIPNGVDLQQFTPLDRAAARRSLGWRAIGRVVLFMGNPDDPRKNVAAAKQAVDLLRAREENVRLHLGWGSRPETVPVLLAASDALLLTSRSEGSPNVVKEAMACARPVVATAVGDVRERLAGVRHCYITDWSASDIATKLSLAIQAGSALEARDAVSPLGLDAIASRIESVYDTAVARFASRDSGLL